MKYIAVLGLLLVGHAQAQLRCLSKLLPLPRPSSSHILTTAEWRPGTNASLMPEDAARALNSFLFGKLLCRGEEIRFEKEPVCAVLDPQTPDMVICSAVSDLGSFIVTRDSGQNVNIIFQKAPRPVPMEE